MASYPANSHYETFIDVTDTDGNEIDVEAADSLEYVITRRRGFNELFSRTDDHYNFNIEDDDSDGNKSIARIYIEPDELTWSELVWEELRVNFTDTQSTVVIQRPVFFYNVQTESV